MSDLPAHLREHADRVAGGGPSDSNYDPETLTLEHEAADRIEELEAERNKAVTRAEVWAAKDRERKNELAQLHEYRRTVEAERDEARRDYDALLTTYKNALHIFTALVVAVGGKVTIPEKILIGRSWKLMRHDDLKAHTIEFSITEKTSEEATDE